MRRASHGRCEMGYEMRARLLQLMGVGATITVVSLIMATVGCQAQTTTGKAGAAAKTSPAPKTPWGAPDGKVPPLTPKAQEQQAAFREYQRALVQATDVCKNGDLPGCKPGPPSPRRSEPPPAYPAAGVGPLNRADGPEDRGLSERCMGGGLPDFRGGFTGVHRRIVQSPGVVTIFYDT